MNSLRRPAATSKRLLPRPEFVCWAQTENETNTVSKLMAQKIRLALLGLWIGAMSFFSFFVAPSAFAVLPSHQAGAVVSRTLAGLEALGLALGVIILMIALAAPLSRGKAK